MTTKHRSLQDYASWLSARPFARGGLPDPASGIAAHSLGAVERAIRAGHGVVLEVQLSFDHDAIVFGDRTLERLTGLSGAVREYSSAQLQAQKLKGSNETLQSLSSMLLEISGRTPVLIDCRQAPQKDPLPMCFAVRRALEGYGGPVGVMAADPRIARWFKEHSRRVARGLVSAGRNDPCLPWWMPAPLWPRFALFRAQPDFVVVDLHQLPSPLEKLARQYRLPVLAGTVQSAADQEAARRHADNYIFAGGATRQPEASASAGSVDAAPPLRATA